MSVSTTSITIIRERWPHDPAVSGKTIRIFADRWQLAKLRWRATAADGRDFGFDLQQPLKHGDPVWANDNNVYAIDQLPEDVIVLPNLKNDETMSIAWAIGNLHQPLQITSTELIVVDDPALRQLFDHQGVAYGIEKRVFQPIRSVTGHHHHHHEH